MGDAQNAEGAALPARDNDNDKGAVVVLPPAREHRRFRVGAVSPIRAAGLPVADLPPLVEPVAFEAGGDAAAQSHRPVRRSFLAPSAPPPSQRLPEVRSRVAVRELLLVGSDAGDPDAAARQAGEPSSTPPRPAAATEPDPEPPIRYRRRWLRHVAVAAGIAAALAAAVAVEIGIDPDSLHRLRALVAERIPGLRPATTDAGPPTDAAGRAIYYGERARAGDGAAQLALAILYAKGEGVGQDYAAAARWFRAAAEKGVVRAQYDLGVLYERGRGVAVDYAQATQWYRKAAEQNHPLAQYNLAVAYTKGQGVRRDFFEAAGWYHRAAAQGVVAAMVNLAILYERGEGLDASIVDAYAWYRAAARRGSQPAARRADELLQAFAPEDQSRAEAKTAEIAASIRDPLGERARLAAQSASSADSAAPPGPMLKPGTDQREAPAQADNANETP